MPDATVRRLDATVLLAAAGYWAVAAGPAPRAADDVVAPDPAAVAEVAPDGGQDEPAPPKDPVPHLLGILAENLVLGWKGERLEFDALTVQDRIHGPDFAREREAVRATVERIQKVVIDEAVANGLARDKAERLFGTVRDRIAPWGGQNDRWFARFQDDGDEEAGLSKYFDELTAPALLEKSFRHTLAQADKRNLLGEGGRSSGSGESGDGRREWHETSEVVDVQVKSHGANAECSLRDEIHGRALKCMFTGDGGLTVRWQADADAEDAGEESVRLVQTADQFRVRHVRDGEVLLSLEGESFRDCCRNAPEVVRRQLAPLLRRIGVGPPALPDDEAVKAEVVARLRRAAGNAAPAGETVTAADVKAAQHRLAQAAAAIDAFRLLDDAAYLDGLKATATGADAAAITRRLEALAAARK